MSDNEAKNKPLENEGEKALATIPYFAYEYEQTRNECIIKRLVIALIISILVSFLINIAWLVAWCQYDYYSEDIQLDAGSGNANYIGNDGDIYNGTDKSTEAQTQE